MNLRSALVFGLISTLSLAHAAAPAIAFSGVIKTGEKTRIALTDTESKTTTWVEPGASFKGYTVVSYDAKDDVVVLEKSGEETRLSLVSAAAATRAPSEEATAATTPHPPAVKPPAAPTGVVASSVPAAPGDDDLASAPTGRPTEPPSYTVQAGDTWDTISARTGLTVQQLKQLNPALPEGSSPPAGQPLRIR